MLLSIIATMVLQEMAARVGIISQKDLAAYLKMDSTNFSKLINTIRI